MQNFELRIGLAQGWQYTIYPRASPFYFSLFTFHFPQGHFSLLSCSAVRWLSQRAALAVAACCVGHRSALRFPAHYYQSPRAALFTFHFSPFTSCKDHFSLCTFHSSLISSHRAAFPDLLLSESLRSIFPAFIGCFPVNAGGG